MHPSAPTTVRGNLLARYYLATPVFALADFAFDAPVRIAGLEDPLHRGAYYTALIGLGFLCRARPATAPWVGMLESATNLLLLLLAVLMPIWELPEAFAAGEELEGPFSQVSLANVLLSGSALIVSFHRHRERATGGARARASDGV